MSCEPGGLGFVVQGLGVAKDVNVTYVKDREDTLLVTVWDASVEKRN